MLAIEDVKEEKPGTSMRGWRGVNLAFLMPDILASSEEVMEILL